MRLTSKIGVVVGLSAVMGLSANAQACDWGTTDYVCCGFSSAFPGAPAEEFASGCALTEADAWAVCAANAFPFQNDYTMYFGETEC